MRLARRRRILFGAALGLALAGAPSRSLAADQAPAADAAPRSLVGDAERERFLLEADVVRTRGTGTGITLPLRATLRRGDFQHDAQIQVVDEYRTSMQLAKGVEVDFRDSYRHNVVAYRLDRLLGLGMVPVTVPRRYRDKGAAFTWWVDDVLMDELKRYTKKLRTPDADRWNKQMYVVRIFDQLIFNFDRNLGNLLIDKEWRLWMIDHTRAFKIFKELRNPKDLGPRCERGLLAGLKRLDRPTLMTSTRDLLDPGQVDGLLGRRDRIVEHFEKKISELGEAAVLYDLPSRIEP